MVTTGRSPSRLQKKSSDEQHTRFVGEYVDETYLQLLADNPDSGSFSISELMPRSSSSRRPIRSTTFALAYASNVDDEDFKRAHQEARRTGSQDDDTSTWRICSRHVVQRQRAEQKPAKE